MKEIVETYLGMFFMFLIITCSFSCLSAAVDARKADVFKTALVEDLENSDFNASRVEFWLDQAVEQGYDIRMEFYKETEGSRTESEPVKTRDEFQAQGGDTTGVYMVSVELDFDYSMPLIDVLSTHTLMGYAK